ncbi:MAG TPA: 30S ribosomal protein S16 [Candidatus Ozemobacteraceae bacterium]|nr:30S ribosomal protein S16 [Candidatus Ozemobacteraceae bacterium]
MSVSIRLKMLGTKNRPCYRVVAVDGRKTRDGKTLENLGHYNPISHPAHVILNEERVMEYLKTGAQPSETVRDLLRQKGIRQSQVSQNGKTRLEWTKTA